MDKIDLDLICAKEAKKFRTGSLKEADSMSLYLRNVMIEAIYQFAVLAGEKAKVNRVKVPVVGDPQGATMEITYGVDKQSILDLMELII